MANKVPYLKARDLHYSESDSWNWPKICDIEVAELNGACTLQIDRSFDVHKFTSGKTYTVNLVVLLEDILTVGTVTLSLNDTVTRSNLDLRSAPRNIWVLLNVGEFIAGPSPNIKFSLTGDDSTNPKRGLVIMGAIITGQI